VTAIAGNSFWVRDRAAMPYLNKKARLRMGLVSWTEVARQRRKESASGWLSSGGDHDKAVERCRGMTFDCKGRSLECHLPNVLRVRQEGSGSMRVLEVPCHAGSGLSSVYQ